jgi:NTP pyrophosphatase (non-canonical NTP hydrolase)
MTTFNQYQENAEETAIYPGKGWFQSTPNAYSEDLRRNVANPHDMIGLSYLAMGLSGEAGEVAGKIKKALRDGHDRRTVIEGVGAELGDVIWYISEIATELGLSLEEVAVGNMEKLADRKQRGVLQGSGDER